MCFVGGNPFPLQGQGCWQLFPHPPARRFLLLHTVHMASSGQHLFLLAPCQAGPVGPPAASAAQIPLPERGGGWLWPVLPLAGAGGLWQPSSLHSP